MPIFPFVTQMPWRKREGLSRDKNQKSDNLNSIYICSSICLIFVWKLSRRPSLPRDWFVSIHQPLSSPIWTDAENKIYIFTDANQLWSPPRPIKRTWPPCGCPRSLHDVSDAGALPAISFHPVSCRNVIVVVKGQRCCWKDNSIRLFDFFEEERRGKALRSYADPSFSHSLDRFFAFP